jgi:hypothetical protein
VCTNKGKGGREDGEKKEGKQKGKNEDFNMGCLVISPLFYCRMKFLLSSKTKFAHIQSFPNSGIEKSVQLILSQIHLNIHSVIAKE